MSRWKKLNDWPDYLERMSVDELQAELAFWQRHLRQLGHREARKEGEKRIRTVRKALEAKLEQEAGTVPGPA